MTAKLIDLEDLGSLHLLESNLFLMFLSVTTKSWKSLLKSSVPSHEIVARGRPSILCFFMYHLISYLDLEWAVKAVIKDVVVVGMAATVCPW